jgi:Topoisomerase IB
MATYIYRKPHGKTYTYHDETGETVRNASLKRWVKFLAIPPAWEEVEITTDRNAKVLATGRDAQGRKLYIYNPDWAAEAAERNFQRILRFGEQLETMQRVTAQHIYQRPVNSDSDLVGMVRLMDEAFLLPGSKRYTKYNQNHGLTTLKNRPMTPTAGPSSLNT